MRRPLPGSLPSRVLRPPRASSPGWPLLPLRFPCSWRGSGALARTVCFSVSLNHLLKSGPTSGMEKTSLSKGPGGGVGGGLRRGGELYPWWRVSFHLPFLKASLAKKEKEEEEEKTPSGKRCWLREDSFTFFFFLRMGKANRLGALSFQTITDRLTGQVLTAYSFGQVV